MVCHATGVVTWWLDDVDCMAVALTGLAPPTYGNGTTVSLSASDPSINYDAPAAEAPTPSERVETHDWCLRECPENTLRDWKKVEPSLRLNRTNRNLWSVMRRLPHVIESLKVWFHRVYLQLYQQVAGIDALAYAQNSLFVRSFVRCICICRSEELQLTFLQPA